MDNTDLLLLVGFCLYWSETYSTSKVLTNRHSNKHAYKQGETILQERAFSSALKNCCDREASNMIVSVFLWTAVAIQYPGLIGGCHLRKSVSRQCLLHYPDVE